MFWSSLLGSNRNSTVHKARVSAFKLRVYIGINILFYIHEGFSSGCFFDWKD